ncbi:MAG: hypothetical protein RLZZ77_2455 [Bacteroidota bacterium]|jgi:uncharacterized protein with PQ loop repeat
MDFSTTEIVGYIGSLMVLVSFLMKDIKTLRFINSIGCALFIVYGILLGFSIPIILTNAAILVINAYSLLGKKR